MLHGKSRVLMQFAAVPVEHSCCFTFESESKIIIACGDTLALNIAIAIKKTRPRAPPTNPSTVTI